MRVPALVGPVADGPHASAPNAVAHRAEPVRHDHGQGHLRFTPLPAALALPSWATTTG
jgi:hypothetical protein